MQYDIQSKRVGTETIVGVKLSESICRWGYSIEMLKRNQLNGLLQMDALRIDDSIWLNFVVTSKMPLSHVLSRRNISKASFLKLLLDLVMIFPQLEDYLLAENALVLDVDCIYADPENLSVSCMYIPQQTNVTSSENLRDLIRSLITQHVRFTEMITDGFVQRLLQLLMQQNFHWQQLIDFIRGERTMVPCPTSSVEPISRPLIEPIERTPMISTPVKPQISTPVKPKISTPVKPQKSENARGFVFMPFIVYSIAVALVGGILGVSGFFTGIEAVQRLIGLLLVSGAIGYLLRNRLFPKGVSWHKPSVFSAKDNQMKPIAIPKPTNELKPKPSEKSSEKANLLGIVNIQPQKQTNDSDSKSDQTILLSGSTEEAILEWTDGTGHKNRTVITKSPFVIGRMAGVDFVLDNPAIGKMHAEIHMGENSKQQVRLFDLNSRNGTFVNDVPVDIHTGSVINDGDRLRFANLVYVFCYKQLTVAI